MLRLLYKRRAVVVWVEDGLTKEYLSALWNDQRIGFAVAAGREGVSALTTDARSGPDQRTNVFGIRDRDFGETNFQHWKDPNTCLFTLSRFEIENYLLDWDALKDCAEAGLRRNSAGIARRVKRRAETLAWWAACKRSLSDVHIELTGSFPDDPTQDEITDHTSALDYILETDGWHKQVCGLPKTDLSKNSIAQRLTDYHNEMTQDVKSGDWVKTFPGKPLLREARSYIRSSKRTGSAAEADVDLARDIAKWQFPKPPRNEDRRPADLVLLHDVLLQRAGLK